MRRSPLKRSRGTTIPEAMRVRVMTRDGGCVVVYKLPWGDSDIFGVFCDPPLQFDHVRASGGMGMKSVTCDCNLVVLCAAHHRYKTEHGREVRPILLDYLSRFDYSEAGHAHAG